MENNLKKLEIELGQLVKNSNCGIDEILEVSNKIDQEMEKAYCSNQN